MNIIKRYKTLLDVEKRYNDLQNKYDNAIVTMAQQAKRIQSLEAKIERDGNTVRHDVELFNKKEKTIADLTRKLNKAYKKIGRLEKEASRND